MRHPMVVLLFVILFPNQLLAQGESAVPFLLIHPSPDANGRGNVGAVVVSDNPIATLANPGQLGFFSLDGYFAASTYAPKVQWLPSFRRDGLTYNVWAVSSGFNLSDAFSLPFPVGVGIGYSRIDLDLGVFARFNPGGGFIGSYRSYEKSDQLSIGAGVDYIVKLGIGFSFKRIRSTLGPLAGTTTLLEAKPTATDFGLLGHIPVFQIVEEMTDEPVTISSDFRPLLNITFGYAKRNMSDNLVVYIDEQSPDPLPRCVTVGLGVELGLATNVHGRSVKAFTILLAREAEDLLVFRTSGGGSGYQSGLGDIAFYRNVILGKVRDEDRASVHSGLEIGLGEFVYVRAGSFSESPNFGNRNYTTIGFGIRTGGLFKFIPATEGSFVDFMAKHVDLVFDYAEYTAGHYPLDGTKFHAVSIVIR
jgi:hypothetical protein